MTTVNQTIDRKVIDRVKKLLALANDAGATEAEAALAGERARAIMAENGITNATIEASGGKGESRTKGTSSGYVNKHWQREIMRALAKQSFVVADWRPGGVSVDWETGKRIKDNGGWDLFGRESAVVTVKLMYDYLVKTVHRSVREYSHAADEVYKEGMGTRIAERLAERHERALAEQAREAREAKARQSHPGSATANALVVVLTDYAQQELDLNNDMRMEWEPGTTARKRAEREAEQARLIAERDQRIKERQEERERLRSEGIRDEVIELMLDGFSRERAEAMVAEDETPEAQRKKAKEAERSAKEEEKWRERQNKRYEKWAEKQSSPSYRAGRRAGNDVGLDGQVGQSETKKLS